MVRERLRVQPPNGRLELFVFCCLKTDFYFQSRTNFSMQTGFIEFVSCTRLSSERGELELNKEFYNSTDNKTIVRRTGIQLVLIIININTLSIYIISIYCQYILSILPIYTIFPPYDDYFNSTIPSTFRLGMSVQAGMQLRSCVTRLFNSTTQPGITSTNLQTTV